MRVTTDARLATLWIAGLLLAGIAINLIGIARALGAETGIASIYGNDDGYEWGPTASGEVMNPLELTAAHRTLAFNRLVLVENLANGRSVIVRINNRGPYKQGRVIDLSPASAAKLGFTDGLARVRVVPL